MLILIEIIFKLKKKTSLLIISLMVYVTLSEIIKNIKLQKLFLIMKNSNKISNFLKFSLNLLKLLSILILTFLSYLYI